MWLQKCVTRDPCDGIALYIGSGSSHMTLHMIRLDRNVHTQISAYETGGNFIMLVE